jgi:histidyl-tRNA synthetase
LDSKNESDAKIIEGAPVLSECLNNASAEFFDQVKSGLDRLGIAFEINNRLVRGLDYYCHTAFEFTTNDLGAQGTVLAGGRYDGLFEQMGGRETPGIGWAAGVERLTLLTGETVAAPRPVAMVPAGNTAEAAALDLTQELRRAGVTVDLGYSGNMKKRMKRAGNLGARFAVMLGDDELARGVATIRDMDSGEQSEVSLDKIADHLRQSGA